MLTVVAAWERKTVASYCRCSVQKMLEASFDFMQSEDRRTDEPLEGSRDESFVALVCHILKINWETLQPERVTETVPKAGNAVLFCVPHSNAKFQKIYHSGPRKSGAKLPKIFPRLSSSLGFRLTSWMGNPSWPTSTNP
jgi:hypothetical protein